MLSLYILGASMLVQVTVAALAFKMFQTYGRHWIWLFISVTIMGLFVRDYHLYFDIKADPDTALPDLTAEAVALVTSLLLILGMCIVDGIFRARLRTEAALLSEKRRLSMLVDRRVADLEMEITERKRAEEALRQDGERFSAIIATQHEIAVAELDLNAMMLLIVARTQRLTNASGALLQWVEGEELVYRAASGRAEAYIGMRNSIAASLEGECVRSGQILRCDDAERDPRVDLEACRSISARSMIVVPLHYERRVVGVLQVLSPEMYAFTAMDVNTLQLMAGLIAAAMSHSAEFEAKQALLTQKELLLEEAIERADRDPLTALVNHRAFHKRLEEEADRAQREGTRLGIVVIDLDNFKYFNDAYGHMVGDEVLQQVSRALKHGCRNYDTLARYGGDEFAMLLPGVGEDHVLQITERLKAAFGNIVYHPVLGGGAVPLSLSIGVAIFPDDGPGRIDTLEAADVRLLQIKNGGSETGELTERLRAQLSCSMANFSMLNALVTAVDTKDRYTRRHSEDVMIYSQQIAQELGLDDKMQGIVLMAALLHDVGKVGVPNYILRKPGKLTEEEFRAIKQHPMMGAVIVGAVEGLEDTLDAIRHHHERWDGQGYPLGLHGLETPISARLMAVADAFSALTTDRPYRKGIDTERAHAILAAGAGTQWDPACVEAFLRVRGATCAPERQLTAA